MSDMHSSVTAAIGALKGPLHGGANEQVMLMVEKINSPAKAEAWIKKALADKARIMGFGHRVYRVEDPRAKHLRRLATELGQQAGNTDNVQILDTVARVVSDDKHIYPNVDLFSGAAYATMGIATDQFTPVFAVSRVAGLGGARPRAARQQPPDQTAGRVHGADERHLRSARPPLSGRRITGPGRRQRTGGTSWGRSPLAARRSPGRRWRVTSSR